jgi:benzodiazapine receptor
MAGKRFSGLAVVNAILILAVILVNALAVTLPLNGRSTAEISAGFKALFVPAGYVFSIWGLIYIGLLAFGVFQLLPSSRDNRLVKATDGWFALSCIANCAWLFAWHYGLFPLSLLIMAVLLASLVLIYAGLHGQAAGQAPSFASRLLVRLPFSIYLGWITVATLANLSDVLSWVNFAGLGTPNAAWAAALCILAGLAAALMAAMYRDAAYAAVIVWALAGIIQKQAAYGPIVAASVAAIALAVMGLVLGLILPRRPSRR